MGWFCKKIENHVINQTNNLGFSVHILEDTERANRTCERMFVIILTYGSLYTRLKELNIVGIGWGGGGWVSYS